MKEIPVQLQVEYKDNEGRKRLRVINDKVQITKDEKEFKTAYDQNLNPVRSHGVRRPVHRPAALLRPGRGLAVR